MIPIVLKMSVDHASEGKPYLCDTFETKPEVQVRPVIPVIRCWIDSAVESIAIRFEDEDAESIDLRFWLVVTTRLAAGQDFTWIDIHMARYHVTYRCRFLLLLTS